MRITCELFASHALLRRRNVPSNRFADFLGAVEGSRYDRERQASVAPLDRVPLILRRLRDAGFPVEVSPELSSALQEYTAQGWVDLRSAQERVERFDQDLRERTKDEKYLYDFQKVGVEWMVLRSRALLADQMGLGKTLTTLAALPAKAPTVVVCPAVAKKGTWLPEARMWRPQLDVRILEGRASFRWPKEGEVLVTNYDILPNVHKPPCKGKLPPKPCLGCKKGLNPIGMMVTLRGEHAEGCSGFLRPERCPGCSPLLEQALEGTVLIADEAHALKSGKTRRSLSFRALSSAVLDKGGRTWLLTATPLLNRPDELWSVLQAARLGTEAFGSWKEFVRLFRGRQTGFGAWVWGQPDDVVGDKLRTVCLRRMRKDVAKWLPEKSYATVEVDIDAATLRACDALLKQLGGIERIEEALQKKIAFESMSSIRAALAAAKTPAMLALVENYEAEEEPVVVFSSHRAPIDLLAKREGWAVITGDTSSDARGRIKEAFQAGAYKGLGLTIQAGGTSLTLTYAAHSLFVDLDYSPELNAQAEDRIYRLGQTRGVLIKRMVADHPLDRRVSEILIRKTRLIQKAVDGAATGEDGRPDQDAEEMLRDMEAATSQERDPG